MRDSKIYVIKGIHYVDNRNVVPYNRYLLLKYNAHINVEVISSARFVMYLFNYIYESYDSAWNLFKVSMKSDADL